MPKSIIAVAPGKVILHGEHAVVYHKMAIACAINGTIQIELTVQDNADTLSIHVPDLMSDDNKELAYKIKVSELKLLYQKCIASSHPPSENRNTASWNEEINNFVMATLTFEKEPKKSLQVMAISTIIFAYFKIIIYDGNASFPSLSFRVVNNNLPFGAGLGSSAAYNVSLATVLLILSSRIAVPKQDSSDQEFDETSLNLISATAFEFEKIVHGTPSGIDNSVSTFGGAIVYQSSKMKHVQRFPKLDFLVVDSGVSRNTKMLVSSVRAKWEKFPDIMKSAMDSFHEISTSAEELINKMASKSINDIDCSTFYDTLKELILMNQHLLNFIGVGHRKLDEICKIASDHNFACKLTGAGGGGCAIVLLDYVADDTIVSNLQKVLRERGFTSWKVVLGCSGVKVLRNAFQ